jgi:pyruvate,water dikinase
MPKMGHDQFVGRAANPRRPGSGHEKSVKSFTTGTSELDRAIQYLRPGDNVVFQMTSLADYRPLVARFVAASLEAGKPVVYFRFARHRSLLPRPQAGIRVCRLHPEKDFERFITETVDIIGEVGPGACYVFDCLSELAVDWYSDRMLGNFFMLACPYLYRLKTVAYFALYRFSHSAVATDAITGTAQVVIDIHRHGGRRYLHPLKVAGRYTPTMYMVHLWEGDRVRPLTDSASATRILSGAPQSWLQFAVPRVGIWGETFQRASELLREPPAAGRKPSPEKRLIRDRLLRMAVTRDRRLHGLAARYFTLRDLVDIVRRMVGTGLIGGKSVGMLLARAILRDREPSLSSLIGPHDSFYIGSDVFYTFLVRNNCWWPRRNVHTVDLVQAERHAALVASRIEKGDFPDDIRRQFMEMLNYFGQSPIIVRSSSLLEDAYGNAFSGKYESVFCANQGTPEQRLERFIAAVRTVYASTMHRQAIHYRARHGLLTQDEQMALLVQRVSGDLCGDSFFPHLAGVGFSFNPYVWEPGLNPRDGMLRMVFGLGTRAVERTENDYTRLVSLSAPDRQPAHAMSDPGRFQQRWADVVDLKGNRVAEREVSDLLPILPDAVKTILTRWDDSLARRMEESGMRGQPALALEMDGILKEGGLARAMKRMLHTLQEAYRHPVDIEFTANLRGPGRTDLKINLLQCRPFQVQAEKVGQPPRPTGVKRPDLILSTRGPVIGQGVSAAVDRLVYIVPAEYSRLGERDRHSVAGVIGRITRSGGEAPPYTVLIAPGRWGTSTPSLGVPVAFADINRARVLVEMAVMHAGLVPDISLGTHFFNDLVEINLLYLAVFPGQEGNLLDEEAIRRAPNRLVKAFPGAGRWGRVVHVVHGVDLAPHRLRLFADPVAQRAMIFVDRG